jgi:hypothetical protein
VKKNNTPLIILWSAAGLSLLAGLVLTLHSLNGIGRVREILLKKADDSRELAGLRTQANRHHALLTAYTQYPASPVPFETLVRTTLPAQSMRLVTTDVTPSASGWTAKKVTVEFNDIDGADLGKLFDAGAKANPPWTLLECTLFAAPAPGRVAKATLVFSTVERASTGN